MGQATGPGIVPLPALEITAVVGTEAGRWPLRGTDQPTRARVICVAVQTTGRVTVRAKASSSLQGQSGGTVAALAGALGQGRAIDVVRADTGPMPALINDMLSI